MENAYFGEWDGAGLHDYLTFVAHAAQERTDFFAPVALNDNLAVLCAAAHSALGFQGLAQRFEIVIAADETCDESNLFACAVALVKLHFEVLPEWRQCLLLLGFVCLVDEIGVGGIYNVETLFPVVGFHACIGF